MPLQPSRRDTIGPPPRDVSDIAAQVRHHGSYLRSLDPGIQDGRFSTPRPVPKGAPRQLVGGDAGGGDDADYAWEYDDRHTVTATGTQTARLSHVPIDETLHVFWHPAGRGGKRITSELFTVDDQTVTIPDPGILAIGDQFSFQYEYEIDDQALDFEFIGAVVGVFHNPGGGYDGSYLTYTPPPEMLPGDFLVVANRGEAAPGGGDVTLGFTSADARLSRLYASTPPVQEAVYVGFAAYSHADVRVEVIGNPASGSFPGAFGVMGIFRGVNSVSSISAIEAGGVTPQLAAAAAVAVTWDGNHTFTLLTATPPSGYTDVHDTGLHYAVTDLSYWTDPSAETSIAGTYVGEGCLIIGLA